MRASLFYSNVRRPLPPNNWRARLRSLSLAIGFNPLVWLLLVAGLILTLTGCATPPPPPPPGIAIVISDRSPAFTDVQREIAKRYPNRMQNYYLDDNADIAAVRKRVQASEISAVVAIGLPAAELARGLTGKQVVFCQVFNYEYPNLVTPWMKGVSATPPVDDLFQTWKRLHPRLKNVGVVTGRNLHNLMDEAHSAAKKHGLKLVHVEARSDKETLYAFKRLSPKVQGFWMVPDNRVLSRSVIRDIMAYSVRQGEQVAVFSDQLLALGGLLSAETSAADIAEQVLLRVNSPQKDTDVGVSSLTRSTIQINTVMAGRLNLKIPKSLQRMAHAP